jgi:homogentisate 1,2-dioxygenase
LHSPLDVVGWDGSVYPFVFPIERFQPKVAAVHLPPTVHGTFAADGVLVCSFVPRLLDFHPDAVPCPYPHSSVDVDEILYYVHGNFTSRRGVAVGSISHHPAGIPHGPHPGAYEGSVGSLATSELAVMLDCARPLSRTAAAVVIEDSGYHLSFNQG